MKKRLCIVVPYRDRAEHLKQFAPHMKKKLDEQVIEHTVLIVEQEAGKPFNRAKLLNVGFDFTKGEYDYYCFHDVDMLPLESDYSYCPNPTHLASRAEQFGWKLPYNNYFGGVTIFDRESFQKINGYANEFWGWGAEDDDVFNRCVDSGVKTSRKNCSFRSLSHERKIDNSLYQENMRKLHTKKYDDGLKNLRYTLTDAKTQDLYTIIRVFI
jgi:predicted glycosyltransferase involved in capsule biosynthesis